MSFIPPLRLRRSATAHKRPTSLDILEGEATVNYNQSSPGLFFKDTNGNIVKIGPVEISSTAPNSSPAGASGNSEGELWFDTTTEQLKVFYNGSWFALTSSPVTGYTGQPRVGNTTFTIVNGIITDVV